MMSSLSRQALALNVQPRNDTVEEHVGWCVRGKSFRAIQVILDHLS